MTPVPSLGFVEGVAQPLEKRFEVIKDVGDGSFGSVVLARVRGTRNMVAIKSMKKSFDSFSECLRLREVQSLRAIPQHPHIVPVLDAFLDPMTHKLHLVMELMEVNLYQLLKSRENKPFEPRIVQVILYQVVSALQHIHAHGFFHRDIKPENVLISVQQPHHKQSNSTSQSQQRLVYTPPATPPAKPSPCSYIVKLADFGLAREIRSRPPYTSYVSTRWYRAPEVLLRAEEYSAPVDIWAVGAMAIEVATLRPIFPGTNEIDQLWRVCEVMGTPSDWYTTEERTGRKVRVGGGPWTTGLKLADALSFKFPKVPPIEMATILTSPWPKSLSEFVVACLAWDPKRRPTSAQCMNHEYFREVEKYIPVRDPLPTPPATMHTLTAGAQNGVKSLDVPQHPRGARQQPSYSSIPYQQPELNHQQSQPQLQQASKGGWFRGRDKKRDSSATQLPPQLPQINIAPSLPSIAPKIIAPGVSGGMAFSPSKPTRPPPHPQPEQKVPYPRETPIEMPPPLNPPKFAEQAAKISWTQIQVPGQHLRQGELSHLPSLPSIRPISPMHGNVFSDSIHRKPVATTPGRDKSPLRQPLVNTFLQQALELERLGNENLISPQSTKIGRQLSAASGDVSPRPDQLTSPSEGPSDDLGAGKAGFFSHFRKRPRKGMSFGGDEMVSPEAMPVSPLPQLGPIQFGADKSVRNSIVMEDFFEDAREEFETDLMREVDEALSSSFRPTHITIAPSPMKGQFSSYPPSSHKNSGVSPALPIKFARPVPSPYPNTTVTVETLPKLPPLTIPKRGSSRKLSADTPDSGNSSRARRPNATPSPLPRIIDDIIPTIPGAYPLSSSPDIVSALDERGGSVPMSRSATNLSVNLPGAYPKERNRYNSSSSGLSSAASYRTAFDPETWDTEEQKQKEEQIMLQQSLMDATRAMRALEKYTYTDWTERKPAASVGDESEETRMQEASVTAWPTPPYVNEDTSAKRVNPPPKADIDYFRIGIPSPSDYR